MGPGICHFILRRLMALMLPLSLLCLSLGLGAQEGVNIRIGSAEGPELGDVHAVDHVDPGAQSLTYVIVNDGSDPFLFSPSISESRGVTNPVIEDEDGNEPEASVEIAPNERFTFRVRFTLEWDAAWYLNVENDDDIGNWTIRPLETADVGIALSRDGRRLFQEYVNISVPYYRLRDGVGSLPDDSDSTLTYQIRNLGTLYNRTVTLKWEYWAVDESRLQSLTINDIEVAIGQAAGGDLDLVINLAPGAEADVVMQLRPSPENGDQWYLGTTNDNWFNLEISAPDAASDYPDLATITTRLAIHGNRQIIRYDANGASAGTPPYDSGFYNHQITGEQIVTVLDNSGALALTGHDFANWNTAADGSGTAYAPADSFIVTPVPQVLYAQWSALDYTVILDPQGGSGGTPEVEATFQMAMPAATAPTREGHSFLGFFANVDGGGTQYYNADMSSAHVWDIADNQTIYAHWNIDTYNITYSPNGADSGEVPETQVKTFNQDIAISGNTNDLERIGFTFAGWNTAADGSGTPYAAGANYGENAPLNLHAQWTVTTYTVTYNANGATSGSAPVDQTKIFGIALSLAGNSGNLQRTGYTLVGWNTAADGSGEELAFSAIYTDNEDLELYAHWVANTYQVTFDPQGGSAPVPETLSVTFDQPYPALPETSLGGHNFLGWFDQASGGERISAGDPVVTAGNHTLWAQWEDQGGGGSLPPEWVSGYPRITQLRYDGLDVVVGTTGGGGQSHWGVYPNAVNPPSVTQLLAGLDGDNQPAISSGQVPNLANAFFRIRTGGLQPLTTYRFFVVAVNIDEVAQEEVTELEFRTVVRVEFPNIDEQMAISQGSDTVYNPIAPATPEGWQNLYDAIRDRPSREVRAFVWDAADQEYRSLPLPQAQGMPAVTRGAFLATRVRLGLDFSGSATASPLEISLQPGWNFIGIPPVLSTVTDEVTTAIPVDDLEWKDPDDLPVAALTIMRYQLPQRNYVQVSAGADLIATQAYWVYNPGAENITMRFDTEMAFTRLPTFHAGEEP
ncbi:MAG: hypothetical protein EA402_03140 [Planctomycetota bacterium]|nr:MAG: hypothetical protein EA402_03140 [Planctomycetota bacterium]